MTHESTDTRMRLLEVPIPGGRTLHIALTFDQDGAPADLAIGAGYDGDSALRALGRGLNVPADTLPALRDALTALEAL